jgi:hypothetical protein
MDGSKLEFLIALLDDPDETIYETVREKMEEEGVQAIERLEHIWETTLDELLQKRIELIIQSIQFNDTKERIKNWAGNENLDLFEGAFLLARYQYPGLKLKEVRSQLEKIKKEVSTEFKNSYSILEKVSILNHVFFSRYKFRINRATTSLPENCYINRVLDIRKGYPISIAILYLLVGRELQLPLHYFDFEENPLIGYTDEKALKPEGQEGEGKTSMMFYINIANKGAIIGPREIEYFHHTDEETSGKDSLKPCTDRQIIKLLVEKLKDDYKKAGSQEKVDYLKEIVDIL